MGGVSVVATEDVRAHLMSDRTDNPALYGFFWHGTDANKAITGCFVPFTT